jgi:hypothetical protein
MIMEPVEHFSPDYAEARGKFVAAAKARSLATETHALPERRGAGGETLTTDVALLGRAKAEALLVLTSATHGVEGHCGSGVQIGLLHDDGFVAAVEAARIAVLLVHAVNPHGFSHGRRVNEDNIDLNRNFRDFSRPPPPNPAYADLHPLLLPATWPPSPENEAAIGAYIARNGEHAFQAAVTSGQHAFPDGLFFGGTHAAWSNRMLRSVLRKHAAGRRRVGWIDFHTALGPRGHGEKIYAGHDRAADLERARRWWGADVTSFYEGSSTSARVSGMVTGAGYDECPGAQFTAIALEYGTLPLRQVLQALRADHWLHNHPEAAAELRAAIRRQVREAFYVDADDWKEQVYAQARVAALAAVARLASSAG